MWGEGVRVRPAAVAGRFYPGDPDALSALVDALLATAPPSRDHRRPVALVAPHAGFRFSGLVAAAAHAHLASWRGDVARVIVLGPAHLTPLQGMALPSVDALDTPLGPVPVDADARRVAAGLSGVVIDDVPHASEHAIETQLPFLIRTLGSAVRVLPVVVGDTPPPVVATLLSTLLDAPGTVAVVSTDLSHYLDRATARECDIATAAAVLARNGTRCTRPTPAGSTPCAGCCATPWTATSSSSYSGWPPPRTPGVIPGASSDTEPSCSMRELANPLSGSRTRPRRLISGHMPRTRTEYQAFEDRPPPDPAVYRACWVVQAPVGMRGHAEMCR
jgi:MEMO1 family protein